MTIRLYVCVCRIWWFQANHLSWFITFWLKEQWVGLGKQRIRFTDPLSISSGKRTNQEWSRNSIYSTLSACWVSQHHVNIIIKLTVPSSSILRGHCLELLLVWMPRFPPKCSHFLIQVLTQSLCYIRGWDMPDWNEKGRNGPAHWLRCLGQRMVLILTAILQC